jgi:2-keto-4-pentenoate hydratase/2-oxohepta-3-ene-1,7-dioic acid hydratase in catechol pathway
MKLGRILRDGPDGPEPRLAVAVPEDGRVVDLVSAERDRLEQEGATREAAARIAAALFPPSTAAALAGGDTFRHAAERTAGAGGAGDLPLDGVEWTSPVDPPAMLDASAFEQHLVNAHARGKREVPDHFYQVPVYYKMNPVTVLAPDAEVPWPGGVGFMDYELEFALVIGAAERIFIPTRPGVTSSASP